MRKQTKDEELQLKSPCPAVNLQTKAQKVPACNYRTAKTVFLRLPSPRLSERRKPNRSSPKETVHNGRSVSSTRLGSFTDYKLRTRVIIRGLGYFVCFPQTPMKTFLTSKTFCELSFYSIQTIVIDI